MPLRRSFQLPSVSFDRCARWCHSTLQSAIDWRVRLWQSTAARPETDAFAHARDGCVWTVSCHSEHGACVLQLLQSRMIERPRDLIQACSGSMLCSAPDCMRGFAADKLRGIPPGLSMVSQDCLYSCQLFRCLLLTLSISRQQEAILYPAPVVFVFCLVDSSRYSVHHSC